MIDKYGMVMTVELERSVNEMCNWSDVIEEIALEKGRKEGIEQGIIVTIELLSELGNETDTIIPLIMKKYEISEEKAIELVSKSK